jgi:hypothetical protein
VFALVVRSQRETHEASDPRISPATIAVANAAG